MVEFLDRLRNEWQVIRGAPFSFFIVCVLAIGVIWSGFHYSYKNKLEDMEGRASNWQNNSSYWKEQAEKPKPTPVCPPQMDQQPAPKLTTHAQSNKRKADGPSIKQDCGGGDCAVSNNQQGGVTAGKIEYTNAPPRRLTEDQRKGIADYLKTLPPTVKFAIGAVYTATNGEDYALQFMPLFDGRHAHDSKAVALRIGIPKQVDYVGVFVGTVSDADSMASYRNSFAKQLVALGIDAHPMNDPTLQPGDLELVVGYQQEEIKQR